MPPQDATAIAGRLQQAALRVTGPRVAVLSALDGLTGHPDVETIGAAARPRLRGLSTQGLYDILRAFTAAGLVRRIEIAGGPARYETRVGDNHHHLVCRACGDTRDVDCVVGSAACLQPSDAAGFAIDEAEVTFWGVCPACASPDQKAIA